MSISNTFNHNLTTYSIAQALLKQSFSVIPTHNNKVAAARWTHFQSNLATDKHLQEWFINNSHQLAVICGSLSRLIVLDFDAHAQYAQFQQKHPDLCNTFVVRTRRGWHLWYRIPENKFVKSTSSTGIDLLAEGKYAVCPPSTINGHTYSVEEFKPVLEITHDEISNIRAFVHSNKPEITSQSGGIDVAATYSLDELQRIYLTHATVGNRNNTLFRTAITARDSGWTQREVIGALAHLYVDQALSGENAHSRYRQAIRTIRSAFSRPAKIQGKIGQGHICNTIVEALKGIKRTKVLRLWIGLLELGYKPGDYISVEEAHNLLQSAGVGRDSIRVAFNFETENGRLFMVHKGYSNPSPRTPSHANAAIATLPDETKKCFLLSQTKPVKTQLAGRKKHYFCIPTESYGAFILSVKLCRTADPIKLEDISTAKNTRLTIHRNLFVRRPGYYDSTWLARRLGVHVVTKNRYDNAIADLHKSARFYDIRIHWGNLAVISDADNKGGIFLMDNETGKRYPPSIGIARRLLKQKREVLLRRQTRNFYWVGSGFSGIRAESDIRELKKQRLPMIQEQPEMWREAAAAYWDSINLPFEPEIYLESTQQTSDATPTHGEAAKHTEVSARKKTEEVKRNPRRKMRTASDEKLVERLQEQVNTMTSDSKYHISKRTIRELIYGYGKRDVLRAIRNIERRNNVINPTGFLRVMLRSDAKAKQVKALLG